jgi:hypothetical protein
MKKKLYLLVGVAVGYVLGSRAGRERYEEMKAASLRMVRNRQP